MGPLICVLLCLSGDVLATHFAFGTINWVVTGRNAQGLTTVKITQHYSFRRNFALANWGYPSSPTYQTSCSQMYDPAIGACPLFTLNTQSSFNILTRTGPATYSTPLVVSALSTFMVMQESKDYIALAPTSDINWIRGIQLYDWVVPDDTKEYIVLYSSSARLSTILDGNNDLSWLVSCNIKIFDTFFRSRSPRTTGSSREFLESCVQSGFTVPRILSDGRPLGIYSSLNQCSTTVPMGQYNGSFYLPKSCLATALPSAATVCPSFPSTMLTPLTGAFLWSPKNPNQTLCSSATTPTNCVNLNNANKIGCFWNVYATRCEKRDEYAIQFTLFESSPTSLFTTYDVIFEVSQSCAMFDSTCNHAPHFSPRYIGPYYGTPNTPFDATYHKTICGNPSATSCPCPRGVENAFPINAVDYDTSQTVTASVSILPFGASFSSATFLGPITDPYESNVLKSWTRYTLKWIPALDSVDAVICFQALDSQAKLSNGNYCLTFAVVEVEFIYVSGVLRDFMANHSDFARPETTADNDAQWVQSGLSNGKPVRFSNSTVPVTTITNFEQWFNTIPGVNQQTVFSTSFAKLTNEDRFTYSNTNFLPINGLLYGNDNTQGWAARGAINSFFTYEMHTYLTWNATTNVNYTYGSTDDMWVFINGILVPGWSLHGVHPAKFHVVDLNKLYFQQGNPLQFLPDTSLYRVDLFYADRSANRTAPMIQMQLPQARLCDASSAGVIEMQFVFNGTYSALPGTSTNQRGYARIESQGLNLAYQSQASGMSYMADAMNLPKRIRVHQGFEATFDFRILSGPTQGFAFVINSQVNSPGSIGNQLGYGGLSKLLAVEFDTNIDAALGDPNYDHVAVMAPYLNTSGFGNLVNSSHFYALGCSIYSSSYPAFGPQLTFTNGSVHSVRINYVPPRQGDQSVFGWLRVWIGNVIAPVVEVPIPAGFFGDMIGTTGYVGFHGAAGPEAASKVFINRFRLTTVPVSPATTGVVTWETSFSAGMVSSVMIQSRDSCGNDLNWGADQARFSAQIRIVSSNRVILPGTAVFTSNDNGTYNFSYAITRAGQYKVFIMFDGNEIRGSGATITVNPGPIGSFATRFSFGSLPILPGNAISTVPGLYLIAVHPTDGTILGRIQESVPANILAWLNSFATSTVFAIVNIDSFTGTSAPLVAKFNSMGCTNFSALASAPSSWACISNYSSSTQTFAVAEPGQQIKQYINANKFAIVAQADVTKSIGYLNVIQDQSTGLTFPANVGTTVTVIAMDVYGNTLQTLPSNPFLIAFTPELASGPLSLIAAPGAPGYYAAPVFSATSSVYMMSIVLSPELGGGNIYGSAAILAFVTGSPTTMVPSQPSSQPTSSPTKNTGEPTHAPSSVPTAFPSRFPTVLPTLSPTSIPPTVTALPTLSPTSPTTPPTTTSLPTRAPTSIATALPTLSPTQAPTSIPTTATALPTQAPTSAAALPTLSPTALPTRAPTSPPTATALPTLSPSSTALPTQAPTFPASLPTSLPTRAPTSPPTATALPTLSPSSIATALPTLSPTSPTSTLATALPTRAPTSTPPTATALPTLSPTSPVPTFPVLPTESPTKLPVLSTTLPTHSPSIPSADSPTTLVPTQLPTLRTLSTHSPSSLPTPLPALPTSLPSNSPTTASPTIGTPTRPTKRVPTNAPTRKCPAQFGVLFTACSDGDFVSSKARSCSAACQNASSIVDEAAATYVDVPDFLEACFDQFNQGRFNAHSKGYLMSALGKGMGICFSEVNAAPALVQGSLLFLVALAGVAFLLAL